MNEHPEKPTNTPEIQVEVDPPTAPTDDQRALLKAARVKFKKAKAAVKIAKKAAIQAKKEVRKLKKSMARK